MSRDKPSDTLEKEARRCGYVRIAGLDEAGRGPLAGPVVAAAVVLPPGFSSAGLDDSKVVPESRRERLYEEIQRHALGIGIGSASAAEIDRVNILEATRLAMGRAIQALIPRPDFLLLDAVSLPAVPLPQRPIVHGDRLSTSIAAASILAKVTRDGLMRRLHEQHPQYRFDRHKGYGTREHLRLLAQYGACEAHRKSFRPVREHLPVG